MQRVNQRTFAIVAFAIVVAVLVTQGVPTVHAAHRPEVLVRRVTTLDSHGHEGHIFRPITTIGLRIQWTVGYAPRGARQTIEWTVLYAKRVIFHLTRSSMAQNGRWSRIATVTIIRRPNLGSYLYRARVTVAALSAERSVTFTVRP